ncbi:hypothetical protein C8K30_10283 [Promicromonospora sp. AC04]|uniref:hypothetical protein n=1 Tax=Promicromonospora sp. AC04 TaxID=2135723 RepID=UPI000D33F7BA|nr:hypothetical protein [Promicromonospora sp. AC04]PUB29708.1 hypothetical protein C8K30_10283 [Promicromonospora sp. AC04]
MSTNALNHTPSAGRVRDRRAEPQGDRLPAGIADTAENTTENGPRNTAGTRRGLLGLLAVGAALTAAAGALGARTWQVGAGLGSALFPIEDIVELAAVAVGTVVAGWVGLHALVALTCVLADRRGVRWAAGERTVARHAPAVVRRLARVAAGAGLGLALTTPTAMALPDPPGTPAAADAGPAVVLDLGWQPTSHETTDRKATDQQKTSQQKTREQKTGGRATDQEPPANRTRSRSVSPLHDPAPDRSSLVNRGGHTGSVREPLVVVESGDTLWAIAADQLAADRHATTPATAGDGVDHTDTAPSDAEIAEAVAQWHDANRRVLGTNPDLILPGTALHRP